MVVDQHVAILLVDDDPDDHFLITEQLEESSDVRFAVDSAMSSKEAHERLQGKTYDVILCDYRMGAQTGVDFLRELRAGGDDTPVILLTGVTDKSVDRAGLEAGAADFIAKSAMTSAILERAIRYAIANADRQRLLQAVLANSAAGVAVIDVDGEISLHNPNFAALAEAVHGSREPSVLRDFALTVLADQAKDIEIADRIAERHVTEMPDGNMVLILHDVTERVRALRERELAQQRILHMALHDELTGLPNRAAFNARLDEQLKEAARLGQTVTLMSFDLNKFKEINDVYGHALGDRLLVDSARRLQMVLRDDDFLARLGGDEFVIIYQSRSDNDDPTEMARRIVESIETPFMIEGKMITTGASIGLAMYPEHGTTREDLLANADAAMYRAKATPDQRCCTYDMSMDRAIRERRAIANELKDAIVKGEFQLHFQPQASVSSGQIVGFEALARWNSASRGAIPPSTFIPIAEDTGTIVSLGDWALKESCRIAAGWGKDYKVAVNVSPIQIAHSDLPRLVRKTLEDTGLKPAQLELEVTEATLIADFDRALHVLKQLKAIGLSIAMDDFGTGYSSLSALQTFPVDRIKIDRSFIDKVTEKGQAAEIVRAILGLGRNLNIPVLAEGVESDSHVDFLSKEGCDEMQGFLIGKPDSADIVDELIARDGGDQNQRVAELEARLAAAAAAA